MGVYIKGMEMPKEAGKYRIEFDQCGNPYLLSDNGDGGIWHIIPVPPHGALIDVNTVDLTDGPYEYDEWVEWALQKYLDAPVFLPADPAKEEA